MNREILLPPFDPAWQIDEILDDEIAAIPGALDSGEQAVDPVSFSCIYARLEGVMSEMTETILATARNPILYAAKDFTCTLLDAKAKVLSMFDCLPIHVGTMAPALRFLIRAFPGDIQEGDAFVNNASFAGNAHVGDWTMFAPIFYEGAFVAWACVKCHIIDTGAHIPSNIDVSARDVYEEAIHFPAVRLYQNHTEIKDLIRFIGYNFRYPQQWYGDFLAQVGALWVAEKRVQELCEREGYATVKGCLAEALRFGDRKMRAEIAHLPNVTVEEELIGEKLEPFFPDGVPFKVRLTVKPEEGEIVYDYSEMPDQAPFCYNLTYATSKGSTFQGTLPVLDPTIPKNDGALDRIKVVLRDGALAGVPTWPVGTSAATIGLCDQVTSLIFKTWAKVAPERAVAGMGDHCAAHSFASGVDPQSNEPYSHIFYLVGSGGGATEGFDGPPHMFGCCIMGNMGYESIELVELGLPYIVWEATALPNTGGAGRWCGAPGMKHVLEPLGHDVTYTFYGVGHSMGAPGLLGGLDGATADHWTEDAASGAVVEHLAAAGETVFRNGQRYVATTGGGGGFGNPFERDPQAVRDDVRDGFYTVDYARKVFGVAVTTESELFDVDYAVTARLRTAATAASKE